jgi:hypothetical protein
LVEVTIEGVENVQAILGFKVFEGRDVRLPPLVRWAARGPDDVFDVPVADALNLEGGKLAITGNAMKFVVLVSLGMQ